MDALLEFLHMGGYAFYVWTAYAIVFVMLLLNLVLPLRRDRALRRRLRRLLAAPASGGESANAIGPGR